MILREEPLAAGSFECERSRSGSSEAVRVDVNRLARFAASTAAPEVAAVVEGVAAGLDPVADALVPSDTGFATSVVRTAAFAAGVMVGDGPVLLLSICTRNHYKQMQGKTAVLQRQCLNTPCARPKALA